MFRLLELNCKVSKVSDYLKLLSVASAHFRQLFRLLTIAVTKPWTTALMEIVTWKTRSEFNNKFCSLNA